MKTAQQGPLTFEISAVETGRHLEYLTLKFKFTTKTIFYSLQTFLSKMLVCSFMSVIFFYHKWKLSD